jgi:AcrR family transcriptional regulator
MTETYHHGNLRKALIEEGLKTLCRDGIGSFSLRNLSKKLGVSHAAAYRHFSSKEELLKAILAEFADTFRTALVASVDPNATGKEALMQLGVGYVRYFVAQPEFITLFALAHDGDDLFARILGGDPEASKSACAERAPNDDTEIHDDKVWSGFRLFSQLALAIRDEESLQGLTDREILLGFWGKVHGLATILVTQRQILAFEDIDATIERVVRTAF